MNVNASFPIFAGLTPTRSSMAFRDAPDGSDFDQLVAEIVQHQALIKNMVYSMSAVPAAGSANIANVPISALDWNGVLLAGAHVFEVWLSDATTGAGLTAATATGTVTVKSASGEVLGTLTAKKALVVQTLATGIFTLEITDTAKTAFKVCVRIPGTGLTAVVATLITANYG